MCLPDFHVARLQLGEEVSRVVTIERRIEPVDIIGVAVETRFFPFSDHVVVTFLPADERGTLLGHGAVQFLSHGVP